MHQSSPVAYVWHSDPQAAGIIVVEGVADPVTGRFLMVNCREATVAMEPSDLYYTSLESLLVYFLEPCPDPDFDPDS